MRPFISVILPCRNEEKFIRKCLDSLINQDYPKEKMEILVVDGMSEDKTREIILNIKSQISNPEIKLIDNPKKFTNFAFNLGIKEAKGEIIMLAGAHATYEKDYVAKCVKYIKEYNADNVGGIIKTLPAEDSLIAEAIAFCLSHFFGSASTFRLGANKPKKVDTVFGGCYKREVFDKIGLFNENLIRSQDLEFNLRLKKAGGKIMLFPDIIAYYYPQSNFKDFFKHNFQDGIWAILPLKLTKTPFKLRHYLPLIFVLTLPLSIWPYLFLSLFFSIQIAFRQKDFRYFFLMLIAFFSRHFGYGLGSILGLIKLIF